MSSFSGLFKKAHHVLNSIRGGNSFFLGRDGEVVYSKNNVCVHEPVPKRGDDEVHCPGYLTIHCQSDETIGVTLILQWLPNVTLHKNPASIRSVSPRNEPRRMVDNLESISKLDQNELRSNFCTDTEVEETPVVRVEENSGSSVAPQATRPKTLFPPLKETFERSAEGGLGVPCINVIPNTPLAAETKLDDKEKTPQSSTATSCADDLSDADFGPESSSADISDYEDKDNWAKRSPLQLEKYVTSAFMLNKTPEQFALEHDLMLNTAKETGEERGRTDSKGNVSRFSVNLGKMRSMRLFYSNAECTSGQLVIATLESHYKILHFHHSGLDKLAQIFEQWSVIKARSLKDGSPSGIPDRHFIICQPEVSRLEMDPEEGLYERLNPQAWRSYESATGTIDDSPTIRKQIFFASMDPVMRAKVWPLLLRVYPWQSTNEQRESIKNELFLEYQQLCKKRHKAAKNGQTRWNSIENSITKDVLRTDRRKPFFSGDNNPNIELMKNILLNYAAAHPDVNYIQGMSDLLAPLLCTMKDPVDAYWCFDSFMKQTVFCSAPQGHENIMETNLNYLRSMLELQAPKFYAHLRKQKPDAMQLMFVHRWILLCFKREFVEHHAMHIWECCWVQYRTNYFYLFVCVAIVSVYGQDVITQNLPHDEILLYFASLAHHMDAFLILQKARGLLYEFICLEKIPCALAGLCSAETEQWDSHRSFHQFYCNQVHDPDQTCPFIG